MASMTLLFVSFVVASFVLVVLLLLESGGLVSIPPRLSALLPYLFHFSLFAVTATILLLGISALSEAATPR
jgi:hypothetical protein